jgi:mRNA interferase MazF
MVRRGEIWLVNLNPTICVSGSEIQKSRPCVIISPPEMHNHLRTVIIAPMSTGNKAAPFRIPVTHGGKQGLILLDQIRTVDKTRLTSKFGALDTKTLDATLQTLQQVFAI